MRSFSALLALGTSFKREEMMWYMAWWCDVAWWRDVQGLAGIGHLVQDGWDELVFVPALWAIQVPISGVMMMWWCNKMMLIVGNPPLGSGFFQTVRRRKYKLGPTKKFPVQIFASLARVYISSSSPQSERNLTPRGGFLRSMWCKEYHIRSSKTGESKFVILSIILNHIIMSHHHTTPGPARHHWGV